jgi:hypothetical protein
MEPSSEVVAAALGLASTVIGAVAGGLGTWRVQRRKRDAAIKQALKGLLWRPKWRRYDFDKLAAHFPGIRHNHLRELLLDTGAARYSGSKEYWGLPERQHRGG